MSLPFIPQITSSSSEANYFRYDIAPLSRGMGATLGNALRRVMLTNLPGCAATWIKINSVASQFDELESVEESVIDIILNVKNISMALSEGVEKKTVVIDAVGPQKIHAYDIQDSELRVTNPSQRIITVRAGYHIHMEIQFEVGAGYRCSAENCPSDRVDIIPLDAMFTPARRVNYFVEPTRVGDRTDYDKLTLEVWTDGTMTANDIVALSADLLRKNLLVFPNTHASELEDVPYE